MEGDARGAASALLGARRGLARLARKVTGKAPETTRPLPVMDEYESIKAQLQDVGLFHDDSLVLIAGGSNRVVLDAEGRIVESGLLDHVESSHAVFTWGRYARAYAQRHLPLRASNDDMAQMFGYQVPCGKAPWGSASAFIVEDRGFVATGRYVQELVAAAILLERMCQAELLAPSVGTLRYLNPALCMAEHAVYLAKYSRLEREADDGRG